VPGSRVDMGSLGEARQLRVRVRRGGALASC
jgi:hypothetical protein